MIFENELILIETIIMKVLVVITFLNQMHNTEFNIFTNFLSYRSTLSLKTFEVDDQLRFVCLFLTWTFNSKHYIDKLKWNIFKKLISLLQFFRKFFDNFWFVQNTKIYAKTGNWSIISWYTKNLRQNWSFINHIEKSVHIGKYIPPDIYAWNMLTLSNFQDI